MIINKMNGETSMPPRFIIQINKPPAMQVGMYGL